MKGFCEAKTLRPITHRTSPHNLLLCLINGIKRLDYSSGKIHTSPPKDLCPSTKNTHRVCLIKMSAKVIREERVVRKQKLHTKEPEVPSHEIERTNMKKTPYAFLQAYRTKNNTLLFWFEHNRWDKSQPIAKRIDRTLRRGGGFIKLIFRILLSFLNNRIKNKTSLEIETDMSHKTINQWRQQRLNYYIRCFGWQTPLFVLIGLHQIPNQLLKISAEILFLGFIPFVILKILKEYTRFQNPKLSKNMKIILLGGNYLAHDLNINMDVVQNPNEIVVECTKVLNRMARNVVSKEQEALRECGDKPDTASEVWKFYQDEIRRRRKVFKRTLWRLYYLGIVNSKDEKPYYQATK